MIMVVMTVWVGKIGCMVGREEDWELGWGAIEGYYLRYAEKRLPTIFVW